MIVGVPKEIKQDEYRVAMLPVGVEELVRRGHKVLLEAGAGTGSGLPDSDYAQSGAELIEGVCGGECDEERGGIDRRTGE